MISRTPAVFALFLVLSVTVVVSIMSARVQETSNSQTIATATTLFSDNFDSDPAIAGPVYSWNNPTGANGYAPPQSLNSYPAYQNNLEGLYEPASASFCTQSGIWNIAATPVNSGNGSLSGTYYLAFDGNSRQAPFSNFDFGPSVEFGLGTTGETVVTVSSPNNAISLTISDTFDSNLPPHFYGYRVFIAPTSGAEATGSDYFNMTNAVGQPVSLTIYGISSASTGIHGTGGQIVQCDPWPSGSYHLAKNAIFAVTSERAHSGSNSLLMGDGDLGYDKTDTSIRLMLSTIPYPSNNLLQFSIALWLNGSNSSQTGVCASANFQTSSPILFLMGDDLVYKCFHGRGGSGVFGLWQWSNASDIQQYSDYYFLTTQTWHVITWSLDISNTAISYYDLTIDGVEPSWVLNSQNHHPSFRGTPIYMTQGPLAHGDRWQWSFWLSTQGIDQLSRATAGNNGSFMYVDDISITLLPPSGLTASTVTTPEFPTANPSILLLLILIVVRLLIMKKPERHKGNSAK